MGRPVAYGKALPDDVVVQVPAAASQAFQANGGKFVILNSSRHATLASGGNTSDVFGWAEVGTFSSSSTAGQDIIPVDVSESAYEIPINATQTESQLKLLVGKTCDIEVVSGIQYANYDASSDDTLQIVGYKYYGSGSGEQSLLVRLYARNQSSTGVA